MYRKPGSPGVLQGVLSGPYAGGQKLVDAQKMPRAVRQRLADVLRGRSDPAPIVQEYTGGASGLASACGLLVAVIALVSLVAIGFGDPSSAWAYQPRVVMAGYAAATSLLMLSLLSLYRRRALAAGNALVPGRYLLPLDAVEVPREGATGEQIVVVTPLGAARDARVRDDGRKKELLIVFDGGSEIAFTLRSESAGEIALRRLEHTQKLLEDLTYGRELEKALLYDAFFDVRVDASWSSLAPSGPASSLQKRRAFRHGKMAGGVAVAIGVALGWAAFAGRSWASDRALFLRALRVGTTESLDEYLVRATSHGDDARALQERLAAQHAELARRAAESRARSPYFEGPPRSEWELTPEEAKARRGSSEACIVSLRARGSTAHPEVVPVMEALVKRAVRTGDVIVPVRVDAHLGSRPSGVPESDHSVRIARVISAFERIFSETCPASVLAFRRSDDSPAQEPGLDIKIDVSWPMVPTWMRVHAPKYVFDVTLRGETAPEPTTFRLTMPAPATMPAGVRERSLFVLPANAHEYAVLSARAFDRLYDELYTLFFRGDPRVPLRASDDEAP